MTEINFCLNLVKCLRIGCWGDLVYHTIYTWIHLQEMTSSVCSTLCEHVFQHFCSCSSDYLRQYISGYCRDSQPYKQRWSLCALLKLSNIPCREAHKKLWFPPNHKNVCTWIICLKVTCIQHLCLLNSTVYVPWPPFDSCGPWQRVLNVCCALPPLACV